MNFYYAKFCIICFIIFILGCQTNENYSTDNPNIIIIYTDDLGYGDVSAYQKGTLKTPNIDKLANEGIRFNSLSPSSPPLPRPSEPDFRSAGELPDSIFSIKNGFLL